VFADRVGIRRKARHHGEGGGPRVLICPGGVRIKQHASTFSSRKGEKRGGSQKKIEEAEAVTTLTVS